MNRSICPTGTPTNTVSEAYKTVNIFRNGIYCVTI